MLFRLILFGFLWVVLAVVFQATTGGGAAALVLIESFLAVVAFVVAALKGRRAAVAITLLVVIPLGAASAEMGEVAIVAGPLALFAFVALAVRAAGRPEPGLGGTDTTIRKAFES